mgnify:CR=1 FL=1
MSDSTPHAAPEPIKTLPLVFDEPRGRKKPPRRLLLNQKASRTRRVVRCKRSYRTLQPARNAWCFCS